LLAVQLPVVLEPGFRAAEVSTRVVKDQFAQLILRWSKKFNQVSVSGRQLPPVPEAADVPHSVENMAAPRDCAVTTLSRRN
jgi:hypothetical protein